MEFCLDNIGIISDSTVLLDGLTVITGKNSSGKTTVGRTLYSLIQANSNIEDAFEASKRTYLISQLTKMWVVLSGGRRFHTRSRTTMREVSLEKNYLYFLSNRDYKVLPTDQLYNLTLGIGENLQKLTLRDLNAFLEENYRFAGADEEYFKMLSDHFDEWKRSAIEICSRTIRTLQDPEGFHLFRQERSKEYLNFEFRKQVLPIKDTSRTGRIRMSSKNRMIMDVSIKGKDNFEMKKDSSFVFPFTQAIFLDDPFILDRVENDEDSTLFFDREGNDETIRAIDTSSHRESLKRMLISDVDADFFNNLELQRRHHGVFEKINQIVPGEFQIDSDGFFYVDNGARLDVQNLAAGSKLFFIIKLLLMKGFLTEETVLILDEPESHLHPEWINKLAEILVLFVKEMQVHLLITTHSPNLLLALDVFSKQYLIQDTSHYYLAKNKENDWETKLDSIDENINEGYAHSSIPLIRMSVEQEIMTDREKTNGEA